MWRTVRAERKGVQIKLIVLNPRSHSAVSQANFLSSRVLEISVFISKRELTHVHVRYRPSVCFRAPYSGD